MKERTVVKCICHETGIHANITVSYMVMARDRTKKALLKGDFFLFLQIFITGSYLLKVAVVRLE